MARKTFRKIITNQETIDQINPNNTKLINRFIKNFDTKRSDKSVVVYKSNFNIFFCWNVLENDNKFFIDIKKSDMMDFFDYAVTELKWGPNRYSQMWSSLNSLSTFIENILDDSYPDFRNQVRKIEKLPKNTVREKTVLSQEQVNSLLNYLFNEEKYQEACFLALAISSGARISELFRFTIDILDENNLAFDGLFLETKKEIKTKGFGKQGSMKYRYILKDTFLPYYKHWLYEREKLINENNKEHNYLFIKNSGDPANKDTSDTWVRRWEKYLTNDIETNKSGDEIHIYPHCLRHYFVTNLTRLGAESDLIIAALGWASGSEMYNIYLDLKASEREWKSLSKLKENLFENDLKENKDE